MRITNTLPSGKTEVVAESQPISRPAERDVLAGILRLAEAGARAGFLLDQCRGGGWKRVGLYLLVKGGGPGK